jgi:anthranilate phosphoribosyltransferase
LILACLQPAQIKGKVAKMMNATRFIQEIGRGAKGARDLSSADAEDLFGAILDGKIDELQLGALLIGLRIKGESDEEMLGFKAAMDSRTPQLLLDNNAPRLVVIPSYNGARRQPNLMPLLALLLAQSGVPVLIHGRYDFETRIDPSVLMHTLGVPAAHNIEHATELLEKKRIAFIGLANLLPGLDALLALRSRLGLRNSSHSLVKLLDPLRSASVRLVAVTHPEYLDKMRRLLVRDDGVALLLRGTEGEAYANPRRRPQLETFINGQANIAYPAEEGGTPPLKSIPDTAENSVTAMLITDLLADRGKIPQPVLDQLEVVTRLAHHV